MTYPSKGTDTTLYCGADALLFAIYCDSTTFDRRIVYRFSAAFLITFAKAFQIVSVYRFLTAEESPYIAGYFDLTM